MRLRFRHTCAWLFAAALLSACGGGSSGTGTTLSSGILCGGAPLKTSVRPDFSGTPLKAEGLFQKGAPQPAVDLPIRPLAYTVPSWCTIDNLVTGSGAPFTISGTVRYEDRPFNATGFTNQVAYKPVRRATTEIVRCSDGAVLASGATSQGGAYSLTASNAATAGVYVRVWAHAAMDFNNDTVTDSVVGVIDPTSANLLDGYAVVAPSIDDSQGSVSGLNITASEAFAWGGAFNIFDVAVTGIEFVYNNFGIAQPFDDLGLVWQDGLASGTVFNPTTKRISITSQYDSQSNPVDTDEYDDMVIMHEVGHFIADQISKDDSPGGTHYLADPTQDARLSWSEGWGNYFAVAGTNNTTYVDTDGGNSFLVSFNLETVAGYTGSLKSIAVGAANELAVAATLWDATDSPIDDGSEDMSDIGAPTVLSATADLRGTADIVTFGRFAGHLFNRIQPVEVAPLYAIAADHGIRIEPDAGADDPAGNDLLAGAKALATPVPGVQATATADLAYDTTSVSADTDLYTVTLTGGVNYAMCTHNLSSGADTAIDLMNASATAVVTSNDNANGMSYALYSACNDFGGPVCPDNDDTLASSVEYTPSVTGDYVIRVRRSSTPPPSAGRFGNYHLTVTTVN